MSTREAGAVVERADAAFLKGRSSGFNERSRVLREAGTILRARREELARTMALEMGKPLAQGVSEAEKCAWVCEFYAERGADFLADETVEMEAARSFVSYRPLGVILAVMPWNFPLWQVFRAAAPALMAGNAMLLKHASNVQLCAAAIESVWREAGLPEGLVANLPIVSELAGELIEHRLVRAVTLTGSVAAGRAVAERAGRALKKTVLELGGSDPYVVLADADVAAAAETCARSRLINSGQSCIAAKRFIVAEAVAEEFEDRLVERMRGETMGDPLAEGVTVGPQARGDLRDELHEQVERSLAAGAWLLLGGEVPEGPGAFYPPTVLGGVRPGMAAFDEETFGPVAAVIRARDDEEALVLANESRFGLGAAVFTRDVERGTRIARDRLEAGACFVNALVKSDPRLPFGGIKESGYGRELGLWGIREFVNVKTVWVEEMTKSE